MIPTLTEVLYCVFFSFCICVFVTDIFAVSSNISLDAVIYASPGTHFLERKHTNLAIYSHLIDLIAPRLPSVISDNVIKEIIGRIVH